MFVALDDPLIVNVNDPAADALAKEMLFPPTSATLIPVPVIEVPPPLNDCVPAPPLGVGPTIVMEFAPVFSVMFAPATMIIVPVLVAAAVPSAAT